MEEERARSGIIGGRKRDSKIIEVLSMEQGDLGIILLVQSVLVTQNVTEIFQKYILYVFILIELIWLINY